MVFNINVYFNRKFHETKVKSFYLFKQNKELIIYI
jgi:hypothetical protein